MPNLAVLRPDSLAHVYGTGKELGRGKAQQSPRHTDGHSLTTRGVVWLALAAAGQRCRWVIITLVAWIPGVSFSFSLASSTGKRSTGN